MLTYYEMLDVDRNALASEIKIKGRKAMMFLHPDKNPDNPVAEHLSRQMNIAYDTLSDPLKKEIYDLTLPALDAAKTDKTSSEIAARRAAEEKIYELAEAYSATPRSMNEKFALASAWKISPTKVWSRTRKNYATKTPKGHAVALGVASFGAVFAMFNMPSDMNIGMEILSGVVVGAGTAAGYGIARYATPIISTLTAVFGNVAGRVYAASQMQDATPAKQTRVVSGFTAAPATIVSLAMMVGLANEGYDLTKHALVQGALGYQHNNRSITYEPLRNTLQNGYRYAVK